jgi:transcriptional regulator with XRE-family HTH domain
MPNEESSKIVDRLKSWTAANNLTQTKVAALLGISVNRLNNYFQSVSRPNADMGIRIQKFLEDEGEEKN